MTFYRAGALTTLILLFASVMLAQESKQESWRIFPSRRRIPSPT